MNTPLPLVLSQSQTSTGEEKPYLRVQLQSGASALLGMEFAREVLDVPAQRLTPMPNMPACVLGLLNWRSRPLWTIDLPQLLGFPPIPSGVLQYHLAIVRVESALLSLAVQDVEGVSRISIDQIQSPVGRVSAGLAPYLQGCVLLDKALVLVLDTTTIASSPMLGRS
jgi:positive phototaxis protein PixI